jgi:TolA-binding protein
MKTIKKYWAFIVGAIVAIIGIFAVTSSKLTSKKLRKTAKQIDDNDSSIDKLQGKIEIVEETRIKTKQDLVEQTAAIADLQEAKDNLIVEEVPIEDAKQNILKNVRRAKKQTK